MPPLAAQELNNCCVVAVFGSEMPSVARAFQRQVEILLVQFDAEARLESALDHALAMHFENARGGKAAHQRLPHLGRIGAGLRCEHQRFADRLDGQRHDDLVGDLGGLAVAVAADQRDVLAHLVEHRLHGVEARARARRP